MRYEGLRGFARIFESSLQRGYSFSEVSQLSYRLIEDIAYCSDRTYAVDEMVNEAYKTENVGFNPSDPAKLLTAFDQLNMSTFKDGTPRTVYEIGCGTGIMAKTFSQLDFVTSYHCSEVSDSSVRYTTKALKGFDDSTVAKDGIMGKLRPATTPVDVIWVQNVWYYLDDALASTVGSPFAIAFDSLKSGGYLYIQLAPEATFVGAGYEPRLSLDPGWAADIVATAGEAAGFDVVYDKNVGACTSVYKTTCDEMHHIYGGYQHLAPFPAGDAITTTTIVVFRKP